MADMACLMFDESHGNGLLERYDTGGDMANTLPLDRVIGIGDGCGVDIHLFGVRVGGA